MRNVLVAGVGQTRFGKFLERGVRSLSEEALELALADAGLEANEVETVFFANTLSGLITGQETMRGQAALRNTGVMGRSIINIDNACSSGSSAFHLAWLAVASGQVDVALAIGAEKLTHEDKKVTFAAYSSGVDVEQQKEAIKHAELNHSIYMDIYAEKTRRYMDKSGATPADFAMVTVKSRHAASMNPFAQFRTETTVEEVLAARMISQPLTMPMCSPVGDGGAAAILVSEDYAKRLEKRHKPVFVRATAVVSANADGAEPVVANRASHKAYDIAGIGPEDVHVVELHDASAPAEIMLYEHMGLAPRYQGVELLRSGATSIGGRIPVNTGGGLLSRGHPVGATGVAQIVELTHQLRGNAAGRQREGAKVALAECSGGQLSPAGQLGGDSALAVVTILSV